MELEFKAADSKEYKMEVIWNNAVYANKAKSYLLKHYYLVIWKSYPEKKNTWEFLSVVQYFKKLISYFHKKHLEKQTTTFPPIDSPLPMARPIVKQIRPITKQK